MQTKNLDIYGHPPIPWSRAEKQLEIAVAWTDVFFFLSTAGLDGRPHVAGIGPVWVDGKFYIVSGPQTRKSRNLAERADCVMSAHLLDVDLVVEGTAAKVTDAATLERLVKVYVDHGWPATVKDGAFTAPFSAPSAGPPPWDLYEFTPHAAFGVASAEPHGATRWQFDD